MNLSPPSETMSREQCLEKVLRDLMATIELHTDCMSGDLRREALDDDIEAAEEILSDDWEPLAGNPTLQPPGDLMSRQFAKLYETERGLVLAMREEGDDGPEIALYFDAGISEVATARIVISGFGDDDSAYELADKAFGVIDEQNATASAFLFMDHLVKMFGESA